MHLNLALAEYYQTVSCKIPSLTSAYNSNAQLAHGVFWILILTRVRLRPCETKEPCSYDELDVHLGSQLEMVSRLNWRVVLPTQTINDQHQLRHNTFRRPSPDLYSTSGLSYTLLVIPS